MILLIAIAWALMTAGLTVLPGIFGNLVAEPWPIVIAWGIVSLAWVPVEAVMRGRVGPLARFSITLPLWVAAALCGFWLRGVLGLP
ncbi:MAG: hypothetical protein WD690_13150 [Vicinamibacterales bacterium]